MLKFFGLMTVSEHEAIVAEHEERHALSTDSVLHFLRDIGSLKLALRRERKAVDWLRENSAIRCPQTKRILSKRKAAEAYAEMWVNI